MTLRLRFEPRYNKVAYKWAGHQTYFAAMQIQRTFRGYLHRVKLWKYGGKFMIAEVIRIQCAFRIKKARNATYNKYMQLLHSKAAVLQGIYRQWVSRRMLAFKKRQRLERMITRIQKLFRGRKSRKRYLQKRFRMLTRQAIKLQRVYRKYMGYRRSLAIVLQQKAVLKQINDINREVSFRRSEAVKGNIVNRAPISQKNFDVLNTCMCHLTSNRPDEALDILMVLLHRPLMPGDTEIPLQVLFYIIKCIYLHIWCAVSRVHLVREDYLEEAVAILYYEQQHRRERRKAELLALQAAERKKKRAEKLAAANPNNPPLSNKVSRASSLEVHKPAQQISSFEFLNNLKKKLLHPKIHTSRLLQPRDYLTQRMFPSNALLADHSEVDAMFSLGSTDSAASLSSVIDSKGGAPKKKSLESRSAICSFGSMTSMTAPTTKDSAHFQLNSLWLKNYYEECEVMYWVGNFKRDGYNFDSICLLASCILARVPSESFGKDIILNQEYAAESSGLPENILEMKKDVLVDHHYKNNVETEFNLYRCKHLLDRAGQKMSLSNMQILVQRKEVYRSMFSGLSEHRIMGEFSSPLPKNVSNFLYHYAIRHKTFKFPKGTPMHMVQYNLPLVFIKCGDMAIVTTKSSAGELQKLHSSVSSSFHSRRSRRGGEVEKVDHDNVLLEAEKYLYVTPLVLTAEDLKQYVYFIENTKSKHSIAHKIEDDEESEDEDGEPLTADSTFWQVGMYVLKNIRIIPCPDKCFLPGVVRPAETVVVDPLEHDKDVSDPLTPSFKDEDYYGVEAHLPAQEDTKPEVCEKTGDEKGSETENADTVGDLGSVKINKSLRLMLPELQYRRRSRNDYMSMEFATCILQRTFRGFRGRALSRRLLLRFGESARQKTIIKKKLHSMHMVRLFRRTLLILIQARIRGVLWRKDLATLKKHCIIVQCSFRCYHAKKKVAAEKRRRLLGPEVVEMCRVGIRINGISMLLVITRCGENYKLLGNDIVNNVKYEGVVYQDEVAKMLEKHNDQFDPKSGHANAVTNSVVLKTLIIQPWQHPKVVKLLIENIGMTTYVPTLTNQFQFMNGHSNKLNNVLVMLPSAAGKGISSSVGGDAYVQNPNNGSIDLAESRGLRDQAGALQKYNRTLMHRFNMDRKKKIEQEAVRKMSLLQKAGKNSM